MEVASDAFVFSSFWCYSYMQRLLHLLKKQIFHQEKATIHTDHAHDTTLQLHDGRTLGYAEYGMRDAKALFYFHGQPGSLLEARFLAEQAKHSGIRLIGIDRPGMGLSRFKAGRRLLDWPDDVAELADSPYIDRFAVVGFSGGGPYALVCAYKIPHSLTACGIISGIGHTGRFRSLWLPYLLIPIARRLFRDDEHARKKLARAARR